MKLIATLLLSVVLTACTPMSALKMLNPFSSGGLSVDAQVGKENSQQNAGIATAGDRDSIENSTVTKESTAVAIGQTSNKVNAEEIKTAVIADKQTSVTADNSNIQVRNEYTNIPVWVLLLLLLGWVLPTPDAMFKYLKNLKTKKEEECNILKD
jgi:hypothetical protein